MNAQLVKDKLVKSERERAALLWDALVAAAGEHRTLTYMQLGIATGIHQRVLGRWLSLIQDHCRERGLPALTSIVVHASDARPGRGFNACKPEQLASAQREVFERWGNPFSTH